ncbi:MAG TPA: hypothetical protein VKA10_00620 [Prolixibacteraceae bacterium]|nr:hypothetical protein [Prolixibacteraceae bacterium]
MTQKQLPGWLFGSLIALISLFFASCATLKPERIIYDEETQLYAYPGPDKQIVWLRNQNSELVNPTNYEAFLIEMAEIKFRYPFNERMEQAEVLRELDRKIAEMYAAAVESINGGKFDEARENLDSLRKTYPDALLYSDVPFLEGFAHEKSGDSILADIRYSEFLNYSEKKYSERFRGYAFADANRSLWQEQRVYASSFLREKEVVPDTAFFRPIQPQYYFNSLQPGFTLNDEALANQKMGNIFVTLGTDFSNDFVLGLQYYLNLGKVLDINPGYYTSGNVSTINLALPMQLYRSADNRAGFKFSPFAFYSGYNSLTINNTEFEFNESVFNAGFKVSLGYYFVQNISLGVSYTWYYYNRDRPYVSKSKSVALWWDNEYDASLYYNILKGFSLKAGIKSGDAVAGIYWNGMEVSYNITNPGLILRSDLY